MSEITNLWKHHLIAFSVLVLIKEKSKIVTLGGFRGTLCCCSRAAFILLVGREREAGLCIIPFIFSPSRCTFRIPSAHSLLECRNVTTRGGFGSPRISISYSFQSRNPVQIYNTGRNLSRPLAKWLHQRASMVFAVSFMPCYFGTLAPFPPEEKENCDNGAEDSLAANFPRQMTLVRRPKDRAHRITKRGGGGEGTPDSRIPNPQFSRDLK